MNTTQTQQKPPFISREVARGEVLSTSLSPEEIKKLEQVRAEHRDEIRAQTKSDWDAFYATTIESSASVAEVKISESISVNQRFEIGGKTEIRFDTEVRIPSSVIKEVSAVEAQRYQPETPHIEAVIETPQPVAQAVSRPKLSFPGSGILDGLEKGWKTLRKWGNDAKDAWSSWLKQDVMFSSKPAKKETPEQKKKKEEEANKSRNNRGFVENLRQLLSGSRRRETAVNSMKGRAEQILTDIHANNKSNTEGILDVYDPTKIQRRVEIDDENAKEEQMLQRRKEENDRRIRMATKNKKKLRFGEKARADSDPNFASENPSNKKTALG